MNKQIQQTVMQDMTEKRRKLHWPWKPENSSSVNLVGVDTEGVALLLSKHGWPA